jgi:hypothetical protein
MPVKMFKKYIGHKVEKDMSVIEEMINQFEVQIEEKGKQIKNISISDMEAAGGDMYVIIHYGPK